MSVPRLFSMFRNVQTEPRRFTYKSRYYDPKKVEFEDRKRRIEREVAREKGEDVEEFKPRSGGSFRSSWKRQNTYRRRSRSANRRLLLILAVMIIFIYMAIKWVEGTEFWLVK